MESVARLVPLGAMAECVVQMEALVEVVGAPSVTLAEEVPGGGLDLMEVVEKAVMVVASEEMEDLEGMVVGEKAEEEEAEGQVGLVGEMYSSSRVWKTLPVICPPLKMEKA